MSEASYILKFSISFVFVLEESNETWTKSWELEWMGGKIGECRGKEGN